MKPIAAMSLGSVLVLGLACGSSGSGTGATSSATSGGGSSTTSASGGGGASAGGGGAGGGSATTGGTGGGVSGPPSAAALLALVASCQEVSSGKYQTDDEAGSPANIPICGLKGAVFWQADLDIDCDGQETAVCNLQTDGAFQDQTSTTESDGTTYLDASTLPYVVVPLPSQRFDYNASGLALGSVIAVIYQGQVRYGIFGDEGPSNILGEASYAMAKSLGIDPDPSTGGADSGVTYIAFTGATARVSKNEDHAEAVALGEALAATLLKDN